MGRRGQQIPPSGAGRGRRRARRAAPEEAEEVAGDAGGGIRPRGCTDGCFLNQNSQNDYC